MRGRRLRWLIIALVLVGCISGVALLVRRLHPMHGSARREWKNGAIARIERCLADERWLRDERAKLAPSATTRRANGGWSDEQMMVMADGRWIACQSICSKQNMLIHDLFIGRASDGRWYYSTYHFCIGNIGASMDERPRDLTEFIDRYWLAPFDGESDDCLKMTWPERKP